MIIAVNISIILFINFSTVVFNDISNTGADSLGFKNTCTPVWSRPTFPVFFHNE